MADKHSMKKCTSCGEMSHIVIANESKARYLCAKCVGTLLAPIGTKPSDKVVISIVTKTNIVPMILMRKEPIHIATTGPEGVILPCIGAE